MPSSATRTPGKTTLTEKLLLYGGAVQLAGSVTARRKQRATTSDWMELEKQRGISVSSTVLQFDYSGYRVNLLDTPGHQDFSEDTYRVLTAVDAAIMVIDAGKGIEAQTRKLFEVCKRRGVPIFTFMNKLDRPAREPLDLLDELESVLGMADLPDELPARHGRRSSAGVFDRFGKQVHLFERTVGGAYRAPLEISDLDSPAVRERMDDATFRKTREEIDMLEMAGAPFDPAAVLRGELSPVFFGSAANNFGVQLLLDGFLKYSAAARGPDRAPPPAARGRTRGKTPRPRAPRRRVLGHRRRRRIRVPAARCPDVLGLRLQDSGQHGPAPPGPHRVPAGVLGRFERDMAVTHVAHGQESPAVVAAETLRPGTRERWTRHSPATSSGWSATTPSASATRSATRIDFVYDEIPRFAPECFAYLRNPQTAKFKQFRQGLDQLLQEGVIQVFNLRDAVTKVPLLAAVGPLQFEVVQYRLQSEYGAESRLETAPWDRVRWLPEGFDPAALADLKLPTGAAAGRGQRGPAGAVVPERLVDALFPRTQRGRHPLRHSRSQGNGENRNIGYDPTS